MRRVWGLRGKVRAGVAVMVLAAPVLLGCAPVMPTGPTMLGPSAPLTDEQGKCREAASQDRPLVTEWPASEKANLEAQLSQGGVAVVYSGCKMRVLAQCVARGTYQWHRTTPARDAIEIKNQDDLYAKLPLGAASLQGELESSGKLLVETTVAGYRRLGGGGAFELTGPCAEATHIVSGVAIGAFELRAAADAKASAEAKAFTAKAGGARTRSEARIREAGDAALCANATDAAPDPGCASPIQIFLVPAVASADAMPTGPTVVGRTAMLDVSATELPIDVRSADPEVSWEVMVDGAVACKTPCQQTISPRAVIRLREQRSIFSRRSRVTLRDLRDWSAVGGVRIEARDSSMWSMSGLVRMGGLFYSVIGAGFLIPCLSGGEDADRYCTVSGITFAVGIPLFGAGTWFMESNGTATTSPLR